MSEHGQNYWNEGDFPRFVSACLFFAQQSQGRSLVLTDFLNTQLTCLWRAANKECPSPRDTLGIAVWCWVSSFVACWCRRFALCAGQQRKHAEEKFGSYCPRMNHGLVFSPKSWWERRNLEEKCFCCLPDCGSDCKPFLTYIKGMDLGKKILPGSEWEWLKDLTHPCAPNP